MCCFYFSSYLKCTTSDQLYTSRDMYDVLCPVQYTGMLLWTCSGQVSVMLQIPQSFTTLSMVLHFFLWWNWWRWAPSKNTADAIASAIYIAQTIAIGYLDDQMKRKLFSKGFPLSNIVSSGNMVSTAVTRSDAFSSVKWRTMLTCFRITSVTYTTIVISLCVLAQLYTVSLCVEPQVKVGVLLECILPAAMLAMFLADFLSCVDISSPSMHGFIQRLAVSMHVFKRYARGQNSKKL